MERWKTIIEPFRIHSVEPIRLTAVEERERALEAAGWNLFTLHSADAIVDLLTPSRAGRAKATPNTTPFDPTRANVEFTGAEAVDLVIAEGREPATIHPFK